MITFPPKLVRHFLFFLGELIDGITFWTKKGQKGFGEQDVSSNSSTYPSCPGRSPLKGREVAMLKQRTNAVLSNPPEQLCIHSAND